MLLPLRTNIQCRRTPYANYGLILANVVIYLVSYQVHAEPITGTIEVLRPWAQQFELVPEQPELWQFVTYAFLHGGLMHIIGNMLFLYIFGNNVNDKLGHIAYISFYLGGAVFSGVGHSLLNSAPALGASGAVAAVTGAYLVLFPQSLITVLYWFIFIGTIEIPAIYFIGIKLILVDNVISRYTPHVAYDAHLAGYAFGIIATLGFLAVGLLGGSNFDLWAMIKRWNRRRQYREAVASGYDPFTGRSGVKKVKAQEVKTAAGQREDPKITELREQIGQRMRERRLGQAADLYVELMKLDRQQVLPRQQLLDVANQLAGDKRHAEAAAAYEQFLEHYGNYEYVGEVELMVGLLYSRYLDKPRAALKHLRAAGEKLSDAAQLKMCREEISRLEGSG